jgi:Ti-type conjugative transfer relaxase TraA
MAIYHLQVKVIGRSAGRSAIAAAAYRAAEALHDSELGRTFNYLSKPGVVHSEIMLPAGAPSRWQDRETLWNEVAARDPKSRDESRRVLDDPDAPRKNRRREKQLAREIELALPRELSQAEAIALARDFAREQFVDRGMVADLNVHWGQSATGEAQPHAHIMLTMRRVVPGLDGDPDGHLDGGAFGPKERAWNATALVTSWRARWAEMVNARLAEAGIDARVDHRSNAARGIDLEPQNKIGPAGARRAVRGEDAERADEHRAIARRNGERLLAEPELALQALTQQQSTFTRADLARLVHRHSDGAAQFTRIIAKVEASPELVRVGHDGRDRARYSTREMVALERRMETTALELSRRTTHTVEVGRRRAVLDGSTLGDEQRLAFGHVTRSRDLAVVVGYAGTGKSTMLGAARQAWAAEGYTVRGAALSGIAAEGLEGGSGIASRTIASWEHAWAQGKELLGPRDVLVMDEAGMVGSRQMDRVLEAVRASGAKLVLVGDHEQLQAIEAGAAFRAIAERVGAAEITEVRRQQVAWQRAATRELATGRTGEALHRYQAAGMVRAHATDDAARAALLAGWQAARERASGESQIVLAHTRDDVRALNDAARALRRAAGELGEDRVLPTELGSRSFAVGDRIYFLRNERGLGVKNGTLGTITAIAGEGEAARLSVRLDREDQATGEAKVVGFGLAEYADLDHGYAATLHKAQSVTVDRAHVLATPGMDRHLAYVALTRHREAATLHWSEASFGSAAHMAGRLSRERGKDTTLDYGETEAELCAAYAARRGLGTLAPASEIVAGATTPQPGAARRRLRRVQLLQAAQPALSALRQMVEQQKTLAGALAAMLTPPVQPSERKLEQPADAGYWAENISILDGIVPATPRRPRDHVVWDGTRQPGPEQPSQPNIRTVFAPMLEAAAAQSAAYEPPSEPMLPAVPYRPVTDGEIEAAIDADAGVRSAREHLSFLLGSAYRDAAKAERRMLALERDGGATAVAEGLLKRPTLLGQLRVPGLFSGEDRATAFAIATVTAHRVGPQLVRLREAETKVGRDYRLETGTRRQREAHAVQALSAKALAAVEVLAGAGAAPGNLGPAPWDNRAPTAGEIRDAARLAPIWTAISASTRVKTELTQFITAAGRRLPPNPVGPLNETEANIERIAGIIYSGRTLAGAHQSFQAYVAAEPQRQAAAQAAREAKQREAERAAEETRLKARVEAAKLAESERRVQEFMQRRGSRPSSGPSMG